MLLWLGANSAFRSRDFQSRRPDRRIEREIHLRNNKTGIKYNKRKRVNSSEFLRSSASLLPRVYIEKDYLVNKIKLNPSFYTK